MSTETCYQYPPADLLMQISNNASVDDFVQSFKWVVEDLDRYLAAAGHRFEQFENILDFGCGVGRFLFANATRLRLGQKLFGCDLNEACATWAQEAIRFAEVQHTNALPPLPYASESMDFVYACSVFTHLTFDLQLAWAQEIHRILRPGGVFFVTTHGMAWWPNVLAKLALFPEQDVRILNDGALFAVFSTVRSASIEGQREVAAFHSKEAVTEIMAPLELVSYIPISTIAGGQSVAVLRKTRTGKVISPRELNGQNLFEPTFVPSVFEALLQSANDVYGGLEIPYAVCYWDGSVQMEGALRIKVEKIFGSFHFVRIVLNLPPLQERFSVTFHPHDGQALFISHPRILT